MSGSDRLRYLVVIPDLIVIPAQSGIST